MLLMLALLSGCASVSSPEGGPKDLKAPRLLNTVPRNGQTNVRPKQISLTFDEDVMTGGKLAEELVVTPSLAGPYRLREDGRTLTLIFQEPLDSATTYYFNFQKGITDITEHTPPALPPVLQFSTGLVLDSGTVSGQVTGLLTNKAEAGMLVGLYNSPDTASLQRRKPYYRVSTGADGRFTFQGLRSGRFELLAFADANKNTRYDEGERVAYLPESIQVQQTPDTALTRLRLRAGAVDRRKPFVVSRKEEPALVVLTLNEGAARIQTLLPKGSSLAEKGQLVARLTGPGARQVEIFPRQKITAPFSLVLVTEDSAGNVGRDSLTLRLSEPKPGRRATVTVGPLEKGKTTFSTNLTFAAPAQLTRGPVATLAAVSAKDSVLQVLKPVRMPEEAILDSTGTVLRLNLPNRLPTGTAQLRLTLDSLRVTNINGSPLAYRPLLLPLPAAAPLTETSEAGAIEGTVATRFTSYDLELLNETGAVVQQLRNPKTFRFPALATGAYRIRVRIDENGNGRWDGPDANLRRPAERIWFYKQPIAVRPNWEQALEVRF